MKQYKPCEMSPEEFKFIRTKLRHNQTSMGRRLGGYTQSTVFNWEHGITKVPKAVAKLMLLYESVV